MALKPKIETTVKEELQVEATKPKLSSLTQAVILGAKVDLQTITIDTRSFLQGHMRNIVAGALEINIVDFSTTETARVMLECLAEVYKAELIPMNLTQLVDVLQTERLRTGTNLVQKNELWKHTTAMLIESIVYQLRYISMGKVDWDE
jgi:hypothetical protein